MFYCATVSVQRIFYRIRDDRIEKKYKLYAVWIRLEFDVVLNYFIFHLTFKQEFIWIHFLYVYVGFVLFINKK